MQLVDYLSRYAHTGRTDRLKLGNGRGAIHFALGEARHAEFTQPDGGVVQGKEAIELILTNLLNENVKMISGVPTSKTIKISAAQLLERIQPESVPENEENMANPVGQPMKPAQGIDFPLMPRGDTLFHSISSEAFSFPGLMRAVSTGKIEIANERIHGAVFVLSGDPISAVIADKEGGMRLDSEAIAEFFTDEPTKVSAETLDEAVVKSVPAMWAIEPLYRNMKIGWIANFEEFVLDPQLSQNIAVIAVDVDEKRGIIVLREGKVVTAYTSDNPEPGQLKIVSSLAAGAVGKLTVWQVPATHVWFPIIQSPPVPSTPTLVPPPPPPVLPQPAGVQPQPSFTPVFPQQESLPEPEAPPTRPSIIFRGTSPPVQAIMDKLIKIASDEIAIRSERVVEMITDCAAREKSLNDLIEEFKVLKLRGLHDDTRQSVITHWQENATS